MSHSALISVIVPVYNVAPYLAQCIENLLPQTYRNLEIIIIDDGSIDGSSEITQRFPLELLYKTNKGLSVARNLGLENALGDLVHFMDVDDLINL